MAVVVVDGLGGGSNAAGAVPLDLAAADVRMEQLTRILDELVAREALARASNQTSQADCLQLRQASVRGLLNVVRQARANVTKLLREQNPGSAGAELAQVHLAYDRGLKVIEEAEQCATRAAVLPATARHLPPLRLGSKGGGLPVPTPRRSAARPRGELTCVRHEAMACLVWQALEREPPAGPITSCADRLAALQIAPAGGWRPERCTSLDDLAVVLARVLGLTAGPEADPARCLEALRVWGLPVDGLLPIGTTAGGSVPLVADEVRELLARGLAGPGQPTPGRRPERPHPLRRRG